MDKKNSRYFFNKKASCWDETTHYSDPEKLRMMAKRLTLAQDARVLDVGTGTGVFVPYIQSMLGGGGQVICVDFAFLMLEIAQKKNGKNDIEHICAEIETVGFAGNIFDAVVCYSTFPHFHEKQQALENINCLLKPGGRMFICHTASREGINEIHRKIPSLKDHLIPENVAMWEMLTAAEFDEVDIMDNIDSYLVEAKKPFTG